MPILKVKLFSFISFSLELAPEKVYLYTLQHWVSQEGKKKEGKVLHSICWRKATITKWRQILMKSHSYSVSKPNAMQRCSYRGAAGISQISKLYSNQGGRLFLPQYYLTYGFSDPPTALQKAFFCCFENYINKGTETNCSENLPPFKFMKVWNIL